MEVDAVLEAFKDFGKKEEKETCPVLERFLSHIARTGETLVPWSQFRTYFLFKMENVLDDFRAATPPEQRRSPNPNIEHVPFDDMKRRILKIVDGYKGIPFTIQRLCELLTDPKRNYAEADKFLRGVEKNVTVVSCVYPPAEENGATVTYRMNGVKFPGKSSVCSDSRNVNGGAAPKALHRPKLSLTASLSTNDRMLSAEAEPVTEEVKEHHIGDSLSPKCESGVKNKCAVDDSDGDQHMVKRIRIELKEEGETEEEEEERESTRPTSSGSITETQVTSPDAATSSEGRELSRTQTETSDEKEDGEDGKGEPSERDTEPGLALGVYADNTTDQSEHRAPSATRLSSDVQDDGTSGSGSDGEDTLGDACSAVDSPTGGAADRLNGTETKAETEPEPEPEPEPEGDE